jgi:protein-disulfide isomerase
VVDVFQNYQAALEYQVVAVPTLIIEEPPPVRYIVGSLSDEAVLRAALGIEGGHP